MQKINERKKIKILITQVKALIKTMEKIPENNDIIGFKYTACKDYLYIYQSLVEESINYISISTKYSSFDIDSLKSVYNMTGIEQKNLFESVLINSRFLLATLEGNFDFVEDETDNLENFISKRLRSLLRDLPKNEKEIQDSLENLLIGNNMDKGIDYDRETGKFNFSGREYIPDFIIPKLNLCIEVKLLKDRSRKSRLIEEISADITAYIKCYNRIFFVVYDLGNITDEIEFKRDIESNGLVKIILIKH